jgi:hypothetical protein
MSRSCAAAGALTNAKLVRQEFSVGKGGRFSTGVAINYEVKSETKLGEAWQLLKNTVLEWWNDNTFRLAASLAFYTIFSVAPILLIAVGTASLFFARETVVNRVVGEMQCQSR